MNKTIKGTINFVLVGAKATGKTVYLTSLYLNSKNITSQDNETTKYLKPMADMLEKGLFPSATAGNLHELMFNYQDDKFSASIQIDDVDGHFIETLSHEDKHTQDERKKLLKNLELSEGIIFFFPYEKDFNESSIKEFNFEIDTIISRLKKIYDVKHTIPIPTVIAVSKWDSHTDYQSENEFEKANEYIDSIKFLKKAKEKIESNFSKLKIIPLSARGIDKNGFEPHNIEKPIEFFIHETYAEWFKKIEELKGNREEQLIYISKIYCDIKAYANYDTLYKELESEYSNKILKELESVNSVEEYKEFESKNREIIDSLSLENQKIISEKKSKLSTKKRVKTFSIASISSMVAGVAVLIILASNAKSLLLKSENELFTDIKVNYETNNYEEALSDIKSYQDKYKDTLNIEHKNRVVEIKSLIDKNKVVARAKNIINDKNFDNIDEIDAIYTSFSTLGIDNPKIAKSLIDKKDNIEIEKSYLQFKNKLESKSFEDAIAYTEHKWTDDYSKQKGILAGRVLDKKFNYEVEKSLKKISTIFDVNEYKNLVNTLEKITLLQKNSEISRIEYKPSISIENKKRLNELLKLKEQYSRILTSGTVVNHVVFGTKTIDNEPLGFECKRAKEIILKIDAETYHYKDSVGCKNLRISWNTIKVFKVANYSVKVIEEDIARDDVYSGASFSFTENDIIKLFNSQIVKKDIGNDYYIEFKKD